MRLFFMITTILFLYSCAGSAKPEADSNQDPNYQEEKSDEEVSVNSGSEYERTTSSKDFITEDNVSKDIYYQAMLGPFFKVSAYVPYKVKVEFEQQIYRVRNQIDADRQLRILVIAYYPSKNTKEKKFANQRAKNLVEYASWKEKIDGKHFMIKVVSTEDQEKFYSIGFELNATKGGTEKKVTKRTVYYTGQRKKETTAKVKEDEQTPSEETEAAAKASDLAEEIE